MSDIVHKQSFTTKLKSILWPVQRDELARFIPISLLMFLILFSQNTLRVLKDSILIPEISAEVVSFAKVYCVTPISALFVIIYAKMVNQLSYRQIFTTLNIFFTGYFAIFAFVLYPNIDFFHLNKETTQMLMMEHPHLKWYIAILANWSFMVFYVLAELWPNVFYVLLFWQLANEITTTNEAKRLYTLFSLIGNSAVVVVGLLFINYSTDLKFLYKHFPGQQDHIILTQVSIIIVVLIACINNYIVKFLDLKILHKHESMQKKDKNRVKPGLVESFRYILSSKYLWLMLICSSSFGLSLNLVESVWKAKIKQLYPTVNQYAAFHGSYIMWTGVAILLFTIIGNNIMRRYGWFMTAIVAPLIIVITGTLFFMLVVFEQYAYSFVDSLIFATPLALAVFTGAIQNVLSKGTKYSLWDTSREMLYIPLDQELRTKGKATVDLTSSKIGKSSSSLVQTVLFTIFPSLTFDSMAPFLMVIFIVVCLVWMDAVRRISGLYQNLINK